MIFFVFNLFLLFNFKMFKMFQGGGGYLPKLFQNQDLNLKEQLDFGIRFFDFDIIYRYFNETFKYKETKLTSYNQT